MNGKLIIFSAPSGSGKSTIIGKLKEAGFDFGFIDGSPIILLNNK